MTIEVIRHGECDRVLLWSRINDARPERNRRLCLSSKRIEIATCQAGRFPATRGRTALIGVEVRQYQVDHLIGTDLQCHFSQEESERIRHVVFGDLQNAFIDRINDHPGCPRCAICDVKFISRAHQFRRVEVNLNRTSRAIYGERCHRVTERAYEDFRRIEVADICNVDVSIALEVTGHTDSLHAAVGITLKPFVSVDTITLYGDETGSGIRRSNLHLDFFARFEARAVKGKRKLRIAFEIAGKVARTCNGKTDLAEYEAVAV